MTSTAYPAPRDAIPFGQRLKRWILARPGVARLGVIALLFIAWKMPAPFYVEKIFQSPPSLEFSQLNTVFETTGVPNALPVSAYEIVVAFAMSFVIGLVVGLAVGLHRFSHKCFMPIILLLYGT